MLNPLNWLRKIGPTGRKATKLYGSIVTQARQPAFYRDLGVPDTTSGRYEILVLHVSCLLNALHVSEGPGGRMARALTEVFVADMDDSMRELGVGDLSVPRKVKKTASGLRERTVAYRDSGNDKHQLATTIAGFLEMATDDPAVLALAGYHIDFAELLAQSNGVEALAGGLLAFPALPTERPMREATAPAVPVRGA